MARDPLACQQPLRGATGGAGLDRYRHYLNLLVRARVVDPAVRARLDVSGIVQQTFLEAHQRLGEFRGGDVGMAAWLRRILVNNLADALRPAGRAKRDVARERSLEQALDESSLRLGTFLAAHEPSPSRHLQDEERAVLLADVMADLTNAQREVVLLRHWHDQSISQIAARLSKTPASVVGLLQRALEVMRVRLADHQSRGVL